MPGRAAGEWPAGPMLVQPPRPFQVPTLQDLDAAVSSAVKQMAGVDGVRASTLYWITSTYGIFRSFVGAEGREKGFVSGDVEVQGRILQEWVEDGRTNGLSGVTLNNRWRALRILLNRVARERHMLNPMLFLEAPRFTRPLPRVLSRALAEKVLHAVKNYSWRDGFERRRNLLVVGLMLLAGLRRGEVLRLCRQDMDCEARTIRIIRGKGRHGGRDRTAYMTEQLAAMVRAYDAERQRRGYTNQLLLLATDSDRPITLTTIRKLFDKVSRSVGTTVTPHSLRHSYATLLRQSGVPDRIAMELLGHKSLQMLQRYSHVFDGEERDAAARLVLDSGDAPTLPGLVR
ncbi:MAG: tyrosine-type recombinase/integrase [Thermoanaerobaculaceae bacterium]